MHPPRTNNGVAFGISKDTEKLVTSTINLAHYAACISNPRLRDR
jgi:hypothetical protein